MATVLVTGGAGFIGSHLVEKLVKRGDEVIVLDDFSAGNKDNLTNVKNQIIIYEGTVANLNTVRSLAKQADTIFHLATQCLVVGLDDPPHLQRVNDVGTFNVCLAAKENNCKIVYVGTSEEYGHQKVFPIREDAPLKTRSLYALTKVIGEFYVKFFHEVYGTPAVIIRPFNTFGPLQREDLDMERLLKGFNAYSGVITSFIKRLESNKPPIIFGDGLQRRDFTYITDMVDGLILLSKLENCEIVNLGSGGDISILELAHLIIDVWGANMEFHKKLVFKDPRPNDVRALLADIGLARSYGYKPKIPIKEGLSRYIKWYKSVRGT